MSKAQAQRVARTEAGRAMSQAGLDSAKVARDNGLQMYKRWYATKDTRTRHSHRHLDGQSLRLHEVFHSSGCTAQAPKLFKGDDAKAMAKENINCRCKLLYYMDEEDLPTVMRTKEDGVIPFTTYREWEKEKRKVVLSTAYFMSKYAYDVKRCKLMLDRTSVINKCEAKKYET